MKKIVILGPLVLIIAIVAARPSRPALKAAVRSTETTAEPVIIADRKLSLDARRRAITTADLDALRNAAETDPEAIVRYDAIRALAKYGDRVTLGERAANDPDSVVRASANKLLGLGSSEPRPPMRKARLIFR